MPLKIDHNYTVRSDGDSSNITRTTETGSIYVGSITLKDSNELKEFAQALISLADAFAKMEVEDDIPF